MRNLTFLIGIYTKAHIGVCPTYFYRNLFKITSTDYSWITFRKSSKNIIKTFVQDFFLKKSTINFSRNFTKGFLETFFRYFPRNFYKNSFTNLPRIFQTFKQRFIREYWLNFLQRFYWWFLLKFRKNINSSSFSSFRDISNICKDTSSKLERFLVEFQQGIILKVLLWRRKHFEILWLLLKCIGF